MSYLILSEEEEKRKFSLGLPVTPLSSKEYEVNQLCLLQTNL